METTSPISRYAGTGVIVGAAVAITIGLVVGGGDPEAMSLGVLAALLFVAPFALVAPSLPHNLWYRAAMGVALATTFVLFWAIGATSFMGTDDEHPADLMYVVVPIVALIGATIARFQPQGMARAMIATAVAQMLVPFLVLAAGLNLVPISTSDLVWFTLMACGPFAVLYLVSAGLFRKAGREQFSTGGRV